MADRSKGRLRVSEKFCNGCMSCQAYCSTAKEGMSAAARSRVRIHLDPFGGANKITICRQCKKAPCARVCPEQAIVPNTEEDGRVDYWRIDYDRCTGCRQCMEACPFDAIFFDPIGERIIRCDTCEGAPLCAEMCPTGALEWVVEEDEAVGSGQETVGRRQ